jgi:hypothetical protein
MARPAPSAAALADYFFQSSLLGLVLSGYLAIAGSGYLDTPTTAATAAGILLRGLLITGRIKVKLSFRALFAATSVYYPLDYLYVSQSFLQATLHFICFLAVVRILTARSSRDYFHVKTIVFLQLLAAALLSTKPNFFLFLALFLFFGVATFASSELRRCTLGSALIARGGLRRFHSRLAVLSVLIAFGILSLTAGLFFLLPRTAHVAFERLIPQRYRLPGFSNEVKLGTIGEILHQSVSVMHVRIINADKPLQLKWRGAVLVNFDGKRWFTNLDGDQALLVQRGRRILAEDAQRRREGRRITYEIQLKAMPSGTLFFAGIPEVLWINSRVVMRTSASAYRLSDGSGEALRYGALSFLGDGETTNDGAPDPLRADQRKAYLQLPSLDPRIDKLARDVTVGLTSDEARALAIQNYLRENYAYTIELPSGEVSDPLAYFLFERRKGHCEYYASAMTVMLRTLGIPTRMVTGFQGGVFNPISKWYVIRASDAHAWVEAWLPGSGWETFDPTPPARSPQQTSFWAKLDLYLDAADMFWQDWVVNYDFERQRALTTRMGSSGRIFGARWLDRFRLAAFDWKSHLAGGLREYGTALLVLLIALIAVWLFGPRAWGWWQIQQRVQRVERGEPHASDATLLYTRMLDLLKKRGFEKPSWLTPAEFARLLPPSDTAILVDSITRAYNEARYSGNALAASRIMILLEQLKAQP